MLNLHTSNFTGLELEQAVNFASGPHQYKKLSKKKDKSK